jgi:hypothetical protein
MRRAPAPEIEETPRESPPVSGWKIGPHSGSPDGLGDGPEAGAGMDASWPC